MKSESDILCIHTFYTGKWAAQFESTLLGKRFNILFFHFIAMYSILFLLLNNQVLGNMEL